MMDLLASQYVGSPHFSHGVSDDAQIITLLLSPSQPSSSSIILDRDSVLEELRNAVSDWLDEAGAPDDALIDSYLCAVRFITALPHSIHDPDIDIDPDGEVSLDWYVEPRRCFSVSLSGEGKLSFAGLYGTTPIHGEAYFADKVPEQIIVLIRNVFS